MRIRNLGLCIAIFPPLALAQTAVLYQAGTDNQARLQQAGADNVSLQYQDGTANLSLVVQAGIANHAHVRQRSSFSEAAVAQNGHYNQASVYQMRMFPDDADQHSGIPQSGDANRANVVQEYRSNSTDLRQEGDRNSSEIRQGWNDNMLVAVSTGNDNRLFVSQDGFANSRVEQGGNANQTSIEQHVYPYGGAVSISQQGVANLATVTQRGSSRYALGDVELEQNGSDNLMNIKQGDGFDSFRFVQYGSANELDARQSGRRLEVEGTSIGSRNRVTIDQRYDFAIVQISQTGADNVIDVKQYDLYHRSASITQAGSANQAILTQGGGSGAIERYATIVQHGSGNLANLSQ